MPIASDRWTITIIVHRRIHVAVVIDDDTDTTPITKCCFIVFEYVYFYSYDDSVYNEWTGGVDEVARASLEKSLLIRDPIVMHLTVNFDPKVLIS